MFKKQTRDQIFVELCECVPAFFRVLHWQILCGHPWKLDLYGMIQLVVPDGLIIKYPGR